MWIELTLSPEKNRFSTVHLWKAADNKCWYAELHVVRLLFSLLFGEQGLKVASVKNLAPIKVDLYLSMHLVYK